METYIELFEEDIENLIDSIKNIEMNTKEGEDVKSEVLSKLYSETL